MRAVVFDEPGDEDVLRIDEVEEPAPGPGQIRIAVAAAGVNRADLLQRQGLYPPPPGASPLLGLECAGTVLDTAPGIDGFAAGDRVMALLTGGGYAAQAVVDARCVMSTPPALDDIEAAAVPEVFLTAYLNLIELGGLGHHQIALVHGGSGGVGTAAIQLARRIGASVIVTAGSDDRCRRCLDLGADAAVNHQTGDFVQVCLDRSDGRGVDVVLDCIGARYLDQNLRALADDGRLVVIGMMKGARGELDLARLLSRRLSVIGSTLRSRSAAFKGRLIGAFLDRFGSELASGTIRPIIDRVLPIEQAAQAHRSLAAGEIFGKVVLEL
jgi:putative PIG3 family NAD(P)H quinone oxidoreductase